MLKLLFHPMGKCIQLNKLKNNENGVVESCAEINKNDFYQNNVACV
jgi:hypothetical protein